MSQGTCTVVTFEGAPHFDAFRSFAPNLPAGAILWGLSRPAAGKAKVGRNKRWLKGPLPSGMCSLRHVSKQGTLLLGALFNFV